MEYVSIPASEYVQLMKYREVVEMLEDVLHGKNFKKEFIKDVERIKAEMDNGKKLTFKSIEEMEKYLDKLEKSG